MNWINRLFGIKDKKPTISENEVKDPPRMSARSRVLLMPLTSTKANHTGTITKVSEDYTPPIFETYTPPVDYSTSNYTSPTTDSASSDNSFGGFGGGDFSGGGSSGDF